MIKLCMLNGPFKGQMFEAEVDPAYVGRSSDNGFQIKNPSVSRRHLKIRKGSEAKTYLIEDLKSTNGTFVNGKRITPGQELEVQEGVPIAVGNIFFSLGAACSEDAFATQNSIDPSIDFMETAHFTVEDRALTSMRNLELIYKVSSVLMQSLNINEILQRVLDHIFDLLQRIDRGVILLIEHETGKISEVISRTNKSKRDTTMLYSRTVVNKVIAEGKAVVMTDAPREDQLDRSESMEIMKIKSVMCVPLISRSQIRGVIYVDSVNRPYGFRKEDLVLLTTLSSPAAIAIENALLYSNLEKIVQERTKSLVETEKRLRESEARFKAMFDNMSSGVVLLEAANEGKDFLVLDLNRADQRLEDVAKKDAVGKALLEIFPHLKDTKLPGVVHRVWETGRPERCLVTFEQENDITFWRDYYVYRLPSGEVVSIFDDISERKRAELEQEVLQKQLILSQRMESIGTFAGGTAHNFRNILQAISGNVEYLEMLYGEHPEFKGLAKNIYRSIERGVGLISSLLQFSRTGEDQLYELEDLDLAEVIKKTGEIIERVFDRSIEIRFELQPGLFVRGNESLLGQVFMNLFSNARDAMPGGGKLSVAAGKANDQVVVSVSDTGHGMDKETLEKIFDPFFTLKEVGKGTGLGLSTAHGIVEKHKGSISVSSMLGKGTTFTIRLPFAKGRESAKAPSQKLVSPGKGQKVLIVDDERPALEALTQLTKSLGYEPIPVERAMEAVSTYNKWSPDLVLMDRNMPEMDGIACIRKIIENHPKARIVIISGYDEWGQNGIDEEVKGLIKGYITKPCGREELGRALAKALGA